jgi:predicted Zn-dependent protease
MICLLTAALFTACQTSSLGRRQLKLMSEDQISQMGVAAFSEISQKTPHSQDRVANASVACVVNAITAVLDERPASTHWEARVFADDSPNAFALPGGKIGVNTGLFQVARNQHQLAAVIGHEIAHVEEGHSNERVSAELATQVAMNTLEATVNSANPMHGQMLGLLGVGVQVGVLLPYGRQHESEADLVGLTYMARAGFDPRESVALWRNMAEAGRGQPPEFLSTHPSHGTRIQDLNRNIPAAMGLYEEAVAKGRRPNCL